jgi:hypothetical protein
MGTQQMRACPHLPQRVVIKGRQGGLPGGQLVVGAGAVLSKGLPRACLRGKECRPAPSVSKESHDKTRRASLGAEVPFLNSGNAAQRGRRHESV